MWVGHLPQTPNLGVSALLSLVDMKVTVVALRCNLLATLALSGDALAACYQLLLRGGFFRLTTQDDGGLPLYLPIPAGAGRHTRLLPGDVVEDGQMSLTSGTFQSLVLLELARTIASGKSHGDKFGDGQHNTILSAWLRQPIIHRFSVPLDLRVVIGLVSPYTG